MEELHQYRKLWAAVMCIAFEDSQINVQTLARNVKTTAEIVKIIDEEMLYFQSKDWVLLCQLAGIEFEAQVIRQYLLPKPLKQVMDWCREEF